MMVMVAIGQRSHDADYPTEAPYECQCNLGEEEGETGILSWHAIRYHRHSGTKCVSVLGLTAY